MEQNPIKKPCCNENIFIIIFSSFTELKLDVMIYLNILNQMNEVEYKRNQLKWKSFNPIVFALLAFLEDIQNIIVMACMYNKLWKTQISQTLPRVFHS